ncbi:MAG: cysteine synthase A, partial [Enterococcus sp.]
MTKIVNSVLDLIGSTPIVKLNSLVPANSADVYVKLE